MSETRIPRDREDDYTRGAADMRRAFATERAGAALDHVGSYSLDPAALPGNVEHFVGVAQVPIGLAGPLLVDGEHARGEFYVPLATTEGTLVASYNRGMKLLGACGGVKTTVSTDHMNRAPCFLFDSAREARDFAAWLRASFEQVAEVADATTRSGKLVEIEHYLAGRFCFARFDFTTGDAAGQNMVGNATWAACEWIRAQRPELTDYMLEANFATDKKHSANNSLRTRGKRVVAEVAIPDALLQQHMKVSSEAIYKARMISHLGGHQSGTTNNGAHAANAITAMFIACGQDVANVAESHAGFVYAELRDNGDYYYSITLPSLIVGTYGGGTSLATQRECLELLGCYGKAKVRKFAEIVAATVVAGEISLGAAIVADEWVSSHDSYGRNR